MSTSAALQLDVMPSADDLLTATAAIVERELKPLTLKIDREGLYPESVMRSLGAAGVFRHHLPDARPVHGLRHLVPGHLRLVSAERHGA